MKQSTTATRGRKKTGAGSSQNKSAGRGSSSSSGRSSTSRANSSGGNGRSSASRTSSSDSRNNTKSNRQEDNDRQGGNGGSAMRGGASGRQAASGQQAASGMRSSGRQSAGKESSRSSTGTSSFNGGSHLEKFFLDQLQDIYYAEHKIIESLPKMAEATTTEELQEAFEDHLHQTQRHVKRLEKVFEMLGQNPEGKKCEAIEGIAREAETIIEETAEGSMTRDAALIMAAQKVEHYEIATYGGLLQLAITMGQYEIAELLDRTLVEEEDTDALLTDIAECDINLLAEHEGDEFALEGIGGAQEEGEAGEQEEEGGEQGGQEGAGSAKEE
jgi:ferritin-like metal-binding protein YciE